MRKNIPNTLKPGAINEAQAAEYIGVSPSTIAEWRKDGIGPKYKKVIRPTKTKPRYLYPIKFLDAWLENGSVITA